MAFLPHRAGLLAMTLVALHSCTHEVIIEPEEFEWGCDPLPPGPLPWGYNFIADDDHIDAARFDPNNPQRLLLVRSLYYYNPRLYVVDRQGGTTSYINTPPVVSECPDWGANDWILFNALIGGNNLFKVRPNGDDLTQLTTIGEFAWCSWSPAADSVLAGHFSLGPSILDVDGNMIATFGSGNGLGGPDIQWTDSGTVLGVGAITIRNWRIGGPPFVEFCALPGEVVGDGMTEAETLGPPGTIYWSRFSGLYRTNLTTGVTDRLVKTCSASYFTSLDYDPVNSQLLAVRRTRSPQANGNLIHTTELQLLGTGGHVIETIPVAFPD